jgi:hypothetical protein
MVVRCPALGLLAIRSVKHINFNSFAAGRSFLNLTNFENQPLKLRYSDRSLIPEETVPIPSVETRDCGLRFKMPVSAGGWRPYYHLRTSRTERERHTFRIWTSRWLLGVSRLSKHCRGQDESGYEKQNGNCSRIRTCPLGELSVSVNRRGGGGRRPLSKRRRGLSRTSACRRRRSRRWRPYPRS